MFNNGNINDDKVKQPPQNCNSIAGIISNRAYGSFVDDSFGDLYDEMKKIDVNNDVGEVYYNELSSGRLTEFIKNKGMNEYANPSLGEAITVWNFSDKPKIENGKNYVYDYEDGAYREVTWDYHYAGVVAKSGSEYVTLENYARGDMRAEKPDPRWYFAMYSTKNTLKTFHHYYKSSSQYANPVTFVEKRKTE
jgi:hypothetical protein